jgi:hypothetical protein
MGPRYDCKYLKSGCAQSFSVLSIERAGINPARTFRVMWISCHRWRDSLGGVFQKPPDTCVISPTQSTFS